MKAKKNLKIITAMFLASLFGLINVPILLLDLIIFLITTKTILTNKKYQDFTSKIFDKLDKFTEDK